VELLVAVVIVGTGVCAAVAGVRMGLGATHSAASIELSRHFAEAVRLYSSGLEFTDPEGGDLFGPEEGLLKDYDDIDDLDGLVQSPPMYGDGQVMTGFSKWSQRVSVTKIDPLTLAPPAEKGGAYSAVQITVKIEMGSGVVGVYRWMVVDR